VLPQTVRLWREGVPNLGSYSRAWCTQQPLRQELHGHAATAHD